jgi:hypothetical protein
MEELDIEGLATHDGPGSCVDDPRGRGEAWIGVRVGRAMEPRNVSFGVPTLCKERKATLSAALIASRRRAPRGPRTRACTEPPYVRTGRSHPRPPRLISRRAAQGTRKAEA